MKNLCLLFLVGLATGFISEKLLVASQSTRSFDLYIEGQSSGDVPIDDEDGEDDGSGSGSGDYIFSPDVKDEILSRIFNFSQASLPKETFPLQPQSTVGSPHNPTTTAADSQDSVTTAKDSVTTPFIFNDGSNGREETSGGENEKFAATTTSTLDTTTSTTSQANSVVTKIYVSGEGTLLPSSGMWERTDVLAAVIACGVVGFLCAIFLLAFLAYRMKKKDEGSYDLGDNKLSTTAYHKAPTKEFYA